MLLSHPWVAQLFRTGSAVFIFLLVALSANAVQLANAKYKIHARLDETAAHGRLHLDIEQMVARAENEPAPRVFAMYG